MKVSKNPKYQAHAKPKRPNWGPFWIFRHPLLQNIKKLKGRFFGNFIFEKSLSMPNKPERGDFGIFQHPFCRQASKKLKALYVTQKNRKNIFGSVVKRNGSSAKNISLSRKS